MDYLPLVIFIAVALAIGLALLIAPFIVAYKTRTRRNCPPTSAASTPSMTRA